MILEEKLITLRKSKGLSQDDLANKLDVTRQAVYKWEAGQATPDINKLKILSSLYNVSIDNLLNNNEEIKYANTPKSNYGEVIVKKALADDAAEKDNTKLFPDEAEKFKIRKRVLSIAFTLMVGFLGLGGLLCLIGIIGSVTNGDEASAVESLALGMGLLLISGAVCLVEKILSKLIYPNVQFARTYFNQELEKANKELDEKYDTVIRLQPDILAWFVYDSKANAFGFYFDGDMQFNCPINNYASFTTTSYETFIAVDIKYFNEKGTYSEYKFQLHNFRQFWGDECKNKDEMDMKMFELNHRNNAVVAEIKQRLDIEKSRI